jgi:redox-sensitive bicupin YhaK (pirin superfamily)
MGILQGKITGEPIMIRIRRSNERGKADMGWLLTHHTFSFGSYHDPEYMGFRTLRVINEDYVQPQSGFDTHGHENMEIISYVFQGTIEHRDSSGSRSTLRAGEVQRMTAGTGVTHSEHNPSPDGVLGFFQIWIEPREKGLKPEYENINVPDEERRGKLRLLASPEGEVGSLTIHQDARLYASVLTPGQEVEHRVQPGRHAWIQLLRGRLEADGESLKAGDAAAISDAAGLRIAALEESEFLLIDLN